MDIRNLKYFFEAATRSSFTQAAEHLSVTQSALSQGIKQLEKSLNCSLFIRDHHIRLTPEGERLVKHCERLFFFLEDLREDIHQAREGLRGTIRAGVLESVLLYLLPRMIAGFAKEFPMVQFSFEKAETVDIERSVLDGLWHFGIISRRAHSDKIENIELGHAAHVLWAPAGVKKPIKWLFQNLPLFTLGDWQAKALEKETTIFEDMKNVQVASPINCVAVVRQLVAAGAGLAVLPEYVQGPELRCLKRYDKWAMKIWLIRRKRSTMSLASQRFLEFLEKGFRKL